MDRTSRNAARKAGKLARLFLWQSRLPCTVRVREFVRQVRVLEAERALLYKTLATLENMCYHSRKALALAHGSNTTISTKTTTTPTTTNSRPLLQPRARMSSTVWAVARNICALNDVKVPACAGQHAPVWATLSTASGLDGCLPCVEESCVDRSLVPEFVPSDDDANSDDDASEDYANSDEDANSDDHDDANSDDATFGVAFTLVDSVLICKRLNHHERFAAALLKSVLEVFEQEFLARADDVALAQKIAAVGAGLMARTLLKGTSLVSLGSNDPDVARAVRELTFQSARHLAALQNQQAHVLLDAKDFAGAVRCMEEELRWLEVVERHCDHQCRFAQLIGSGVAASACDNTGLPS